MGRKNSDPYSDTMMHYLNEYNSLIRQAKEYRYENGIPSVDEANCYKAAAAVCRKIADYQDAEVVREKWLLLAKKSEDMMVDIVNYLNPKPVKQSSQYRHQSSNISSLFSPNLRTSYGSQSVQPSSQFAQSTVQPIVQPTTRPTVQQTAQPAVQPAVHAFQNTQQGQEKEAPKKTTTIPSTDPDDPRPYTTTPTGFTTRNAWPPHVTAETIEGWYIKNMPDHDFTDVTGMDELKGKMMKILTRINMQQTCLEMGLDPFTCYLLYGPPGTGKTFLIEAFAAELMKREFKFIQLSSANIHQSLVGVSEKVIEIAFQEAIDNAPCAIYIDEFEGVSVSRDSNAQGHEKRLTIALIEEYNKLKNSHKPIIMLAASNHPNNIDIAWIDRMNSRLLLPLPSEEIRKGYFVSKFSKYNLTDGLDFDYMVDNTDNFSFRDMDSVKDMLLDQILLDLSDEYKVLNENGEIDYSKTDEPARDAVASGKKDISKEMFDSVLRQYSSSPKEDILAELEEYETRVKNQG